METRGYIEILVSGFKGGMELSPENFDIKEIILLFEQVEKLLFPTELKERPVISYEISKGSVRNIFKTSIQAVIGFNALINTIQSENNIDFLEINTARAIETLQEISNQKNYEFVISTSLPNTIRLVINNNTSYIRTSENWVDAEFYLFGKITSAGGKEKSSIHLHTQEYGVVVIQTPQEVLEKKKENILYKEFIIRASGKQNSLSGELDKQSLKFIDMIDYQKKYDTKYIEKLRQKAMKWLREIKADDYMKDIRGYDE